MTSSTTQPDSMHPAADMAGDLFDNWFDPLEAEVRARSRQFIEELLRAELDASLARPRYGRSRMAGNEEGTGVTGHRHGSRTRSLTGTFGPIEIAVPRARLTTPEGKTAEWKSQALRAYQRRTLAADALIASKTQTVLPSADTAAMLFWALLASGQINMRKVDGWQTLATKPIDQPIDLAA
jgi:putative transposase